MAQGRLRRLVTRRRARRAVVCLILGGVMTVVVAWGCDRFTDPAQFLLPWLSTSGGVTSGGPFYEQFRPKGWPRLTTLYSQRTIGLTQRTAYGAVDQKPRGYGLPLSPLENGFWITESQFGLPWRSMSHISSGAMGDTDGFNAPDSPAQQKPNFGVIALGLDVPGWLHGLGFGWRTVPLHPMWPGFLYPTLVYGAFAWVVLYARGILPQSHRVRRRLCLHCAFPVSDFAICPECGKPTGHEA